MCLFNCYTHLFLSTGIEYKCMIGTSQDKKVWFYIFVLLWVGCPSLYSIHAWCFIYCPSWKLFSLNSTLYFSLSFCLPFYLNRVGQTSEFSLESSYFFKSLSLNFYCKTVFNTLHCTEKGRQSASGGVKFWCIIMLKW